MGNTKFWKAFSLIIFLFLVLSYLIYRFYPNLSKTYQKIDLATFVYEDWQDINGFVGVECNPVNYLTFDTIDSEYVSKFKNRMNITNSSDVSYGFYNITNRGEFILKENILNSCLLGWEIDMNGKGRIVFEDKNGNIIRKGIKNFPKNIFKSESL